LLCGASGDAAGGRRDDGGGVGVYAHEVGGVVEVGEIRDGEGDVVWDSHFEGVGVVDAEHERIGEGGDLEIVEVVGGGDVRGVVGVEGHAEVVVEFHADAAGAVEGVVVEVVEAGVGFDDGVDGLAVVGIEERLIEREPHGDAVGVVSHENPAVVDKCVFEGGVLVAAVHVAYERAETDVGETAVEDEGSIKVEHHNGWSHALRDGEIDEVVVMVQAVGVDRCTWQNKRSDACPRY